MCTDVLVIREESTKKIKKLKYIREKYPSRSVTFSKVLASQMFVLTKNPGNPKSFISQLLIYVIFISIF